MSLGLEEPGSFCVVPPPPLAPVALTPAERGVLQLVCAGCSNKEIAAALGRAEATVKHQVSSILRKTKADSRSQLIARLLRRA